MNGHPIWYELMVPDAAAVAPLYRAVLGWDIPATANAMPNGSQYRMIGRSDGGHAGGLLSLSPAMAADGVRPAWLVYFHTDAVDDAVAMATQLGAAVHMPPTTLPGAGRMAMLADPGGAPFYLMTPTPPPGQPDAKSDVFDADKPGHCRWNQLDTGDAGQADAFYKALFGWNTDQSMPMGAAGNYQFIEQGGVQIGAINPMKPAGEPDAWLPYFGVADIDQAREAALAHGFVITMDTHQVPGDDWIFQGHDPAGAAVGFVGPKKGAG
jgi:predicted enzyme related to lactoylglutathione lyase